MPNLKNHDTTDEDLIMRRLAALGFSLALIISTTLVAGNALAQDCTVTGTRGDDVLRGTPGPDVICGRGGDDVLLGRGGEDRLLGGAGADEIRGGADSDSLLGGSGADELLGGVGDDILRGGLGTDILDGGAGLDFCAPMDVLDVLTDCEDVRAPKLESLSIEPASIDTSQGPQTIIVKAHITDDESGLNDGYGAQIYSFSRVFFTGPDGTSADAWAEFRPGPDDPDRNLVSGTPQNGYYEVPVTLPKYSAQGRWKINYVSLQDETSNHRYVWRADLMARGLPTGFDQVGVGDKTAPDITSFSLTPSQVDASLGPAEIQLSADVVDDLSGVEWAIAYFLSPSGAQRVNVTFEPRADGGYVGTLRIPRYAEQGTWTLTEIGLRDRADNHGVLTSADLAERGWPTTFEQTGSGDTSPPQLVEFDFTPKEVDTRYEDQAITFTARFTDELGGLADATMIFQAPAESCTPDDCPEGKQGLWVRFSASDRVSGDANDGVYEVTVTLPRYSELGTWTVFWLTAHDGAGNELFLIEDNDYGATFMGGRSGEMSALGFPVSFVNEGGPL